MNKRNDRITLGVGALAVFGLIAALTSPWIVATALVLTLGIYGAAAAAYWVTRRSVLRARGER